MGPGLQEPVGPIGVGQRERLGDHRLHAPGLEARPDVLAQRLGDDKSIDRVGRGRLDHRYAVDRHDEQGAAHRQDTHDDAVYQDEFVWWLNKQFPKDKRNGGQLFYDLDNEPDLWANTHACSGVGEIPNRR